MNIVADRPPILKLSDAHRAAVESRDIHLAACRWRRQGVVCSLCNEVISLASRLGCQVCGEPHGVSVPCGYRREAS